MPGGQVLNLLVVLMLNRDPLFLFYCSLPVVGFGIRPVESADALAAEQARISCSAVQGEVPLYLVPSRQVVSFLVALSRFTPCRSAPYRFAFLRYASDRSQEGGVLALSINKEVLYIFMP